MRIKSAWAMVLWDWDSGTLRWDQPQWDCYVTPVGGGDYNSKRALVVESGHVAYQYLKNHAK